MLILMIWGGNFCHFNGFRGVLTILEILNGVLVIIEVLEVLKRNFIILKVLRVFLLFRRFQ